MVDDTAVVVHIRKKDEEVSAAMEHFGPEADLRKADTVGHSLVPAASSAVVHEDFRDQLASALLAFLGFLDVEASSDSASFQVVDEDCVALVVLAKKMEGLEARLG